MGKLEWAHDEVPLLIEGFNQQVNDTTWKVQVEQLELSTILQFKILQFKCIQSGDE